MKQEDVWRGIDLLADEVGVTPARLARMAGLDQAVFSAGRRRREDGSLRWPSMDSLSKVLKVGGISMGDFVNYMYADPGSRAAFKLPCLSLSRAQDEARYDVDGYPTGPDWDRVEFPDLQDPRCFGLVLDNDDHRPLYREGDMLVCAPGVSVRRGDRVIYRRRGAGLGIAELVRQSPYTIDMASLDGHDTDTMPAQEIEWITRIAWARQ